MVLDVRTREEYAAGHIPGARLISEEEVSRPHNHSDLKDMMLEFPDAATLRAKVAQFGVSDSSRIVVSFGPDQGVQSATRIIFTLDYLGLGARTSLLNGGFPAWKRAGKPMTTTVPPAARGTLTMPIRENLVVDAGFVTSVPSRPGYKLVDARAAVFFKGIEPTMKGKAGHIPGAINIPFTEMTDTNMLIDRARVASVFERAGVTPGDTVVAYCHVGQQATAVLLAARLLGHPVMLYDGAFQDWAVNDRGRGRQMKRYTDPYIAGVGIGLVLLAAYAVAGRGLGASGAFASVVASGMAVVEGVASVAASPATAPYLTHGVTQPLHDWLVLELIGVVARRLGLRMDGRPGEGVNRTRPGHLGFRTSVAAVAGGVLMGLGAKFARGCTSGQALTGGALLSAGSWIFIATCFATGYALSPLARRLWR